MKKSQLSYFIVTGIVLLIIFSMIFFIRKSFNAENNVPDTLSFHSSEYSFKSCLEIISREALFEIGLKGGYIDNINSVNGLIGEYEFLIINNTPRNLSKESIEKNIANLIRRKMNHCLFEETDLIENLDIIVKIAHESVEFRFGFSYFLYKDSITKELTRHSYKVSAEYLEMIKLSQDIIEHDILNPGWIDHSHISSSDKIVVSTRSVLGSSVYYLLDIENGYVFLFATDFDDSIFSLQAKERYDFEPIILNVGERFFMELPQGRYYESVSPLINIKNNIIDFVAEEFMVGSHTVRIQDRDDGSLVGYLEVSIT